MGRLSWVIWVALSVITKVLQRGRQRIKDRRRRLKDVSALALKVEKGGHEPKYAGSLWKRKEQGNLISFGASVRNTALQTHLRI